MWIGAPPLWYKRRIIPFLAAFLGITKIKLCNFHPEFTEYNIMVTPHKGRPACPRSFFTDACSGLGMRQKVTPLTCLVKFQEMTSLFSCRGHKGKLVSGARVVLQDHRWGTTLSFVSQTSDAMLPNIKFHCFSARFLPFSFPGRNWFTWPNWTSWLHWGYCKALRQCLLVTLLPKSYVWWTHFSPFFDLQGEVGPPGRDGPSGEAGPPVSGTLTTNNYSNLNSLISSLRAKYDHLIGWFLLCEHEHLLQYYFSCAEPFPSRVPLVRPGNGVLRARRVNKVKEVNKVCKEKGETQARQELLDKRDPPVLPDPKDKGYTQSFRSSFFKNHIHMYSTLMHTVLV